MNRTDPLVPRFLFSGYGDLRDLPSFPTRRSSDLGAAAGDTSIRSTDGVVGAVAVHAFVPGLHPPYRSRRQGAGRYGGWRDRKSTRLNSSHVSISYAVFCLKKKSHL